MNPANENAPASLQLAQGANQNRRHNSTKFTPRLHRLASALLAGPRSVRDLMDLLPSNNVPEYIRQLRALLTLTIPCKHVKFITRDSFSSWYGVYTLTPEDRAKLQAAINSDSRE